MKRFLQSFWGAVYLLCGISSFGWLWSRKDAEWYEYLLYPIFIFTAVYGARLIAKSIQ